LIVFILVFKISQEDQIVPELRTTNTYSIRYVKLDMLSSGIYSAPPLVTLDILTMRKQGCFKNFRTNRFSMGIPIIFWNSTYMDEINSQKSSIGEVSRNVVTILPPSNILKYQLNWRRPNFYSYGILLDSSWYESDLNYVLPMSQTFIMEFDDGYSNQSLCNDIRTNLIINPLQRQELEIKFIRKESGPRKIPEIIIRTNDIYFAEPIKSECRPYYYYGPYYYGSYTNTNCYIYLDSVKRVAYEVANNITRNLQLQVPQLQIKLENAVYEYLCKNTRTYDGINTRVIGTSNFVNNNTLVCLVPYEVYSSYGSNSITVATLESQILDGVQIEFSMPMLNI